jgi:hypothetical protein
MRQAIHESADRLALASFFNGGRGTLRVEQQIMKIRSGHVSADVAENFESGLDRSLRFERKEGI